MRHDPALNPKINLLIDFLMLIWHRFPGWLIGQTIPLHHVQLPFTKPEHVSEYRFVFPSVCHFEQKQSALVFDKQWLQAPVIESKAQLLAYLPTLPVQWFQKQGYQKLMTTQVLQKLEQVEWGTDTRLCACAMFRLKREPQRTNALIRNGELISLSFQVNAMQFIPIPPSLSQFHKVERMI